MINILPLYYVIKESGIYHPYVKDRNKFLFSMVLPTKKYGNHVKIEFRRGFYS